MVKQLVSTQVKLDKEFKKFESKLHDTILTYKDCISWNREPGRTNLGETEICTIINSKRKKVEAYIDSGNSFFNCMARETYKKLGFTLAQLGESPRPTIRQAGGGATLQILGKTPNTRKNGFSFKSSTHIFPLKDIFLVEGHHNKFNISYAFLKANDCIIDIKYDFLIFESKHFEIERFPMVLPSSTNKVLCGALLPILPARDNLQPRESIVLPLPTLKDSKFFDPCQCISEGEVSPSQRAHPGTFQCRGHVMQSKKSALPTIPCPHAHCFPCQN